MGESPGRGALTERIRLRALGACGLGIGVFLICFDHLFLFVPPGWTPPYGFAPRVSAAFARVSLPPALLALSPAQFQALASGLLGGMWLMFLGALVLAAALPADSTAQRRALRLVAIEAGVIGLGLVLSPPTLSRDLYHYAVFGKMLATQGLNPYVTPIRALAGDPLVELANWTDLPTHYGPVFTGLSALTVVAGGGGPIGTALAFKTLATAFGAMTAWAVWRIAELEGRSAVLPLLLVAWNPLVLLETAGSGHNEMVMLGPALLGVLAIKKGRANLGFGLVVASVCVKWVTAALATLVAIRRVREQPDRRSRVRALIQVAAVAVATTAALYAPFWRGPRTMLATVLLVGGASNVASDLAAARVPWWRALAFLAVATVAVASVWRGPPARVLEMAATLSLAFVVLVFPWLFPWYLIPALALLAAGPPGPVNRVLLVATTCLSVVLMARWAVLVPGRSN